jgi:hypothetical protein
VTDSAASLMPSPAWARVRILLNLGRIQEAATAAAEAAAHTMWCEDYVQVAGPPVHSLQDLPVGWCFLDPIQDLAVLNRDVVDEFCMSVSMFQFVRVTQSLTEPVFRWYDITNWRTLDAMDSAEARE